MRTCVVTFENLPVCVLSCYGSLQNSTSNFDTIAACSETYDQFFASNAEQCIQDLINNPQEKCVLIHDGVNITSAALLSLVRLPELLYQSSRQLSQLFSDHSAPQMWFHCCHESIASNDLQLALRTWGHDVEILSEMTDVQTVLHALIEQGLTSEQASRVVVSALTYAKDRFLGELWNAWQAFKGEGDRFIVSAVHGDHRLALSETPDWIASVSDPLMHLPLIIHRTGTEHSTRNQSLLTSQQVFTTDGIEPVTSAGQIEYRSAQSIAHRTELWLLIEKRCIPTASGEDAQYALYRKPEDIWEILDVAGQYPDLIDSFSRTGRLPMTQVMNSSDP